MKMIIAALLLLLCGVGAFAESQPPPPTPLKVSNPPEEQSKKKQAKTKTDNRGTKEFPLYIETLERASDTAEKDRNAKHREQEASNSRNTMLITGGLLIVAALQVVFFCWQLRLMRIGLRETRIASKIAKKSASAAKISADSIKKSDRPYLFVEVSGGFRDNLEDGFRVCEYIFTVKNHGKTSAIVTNIDDKYWYESLNGSPNPIEEPTEDHIPPGGVILSASGERRFDRDFKLSVQEANEVSNINRKLLIYGRIDYKDIFGDRHFTAFCWEYQTRISGFYLSPNKELNEYT